MSSVNKALAISLAIMVTLFPLSAHAELVRVSWYEDGTRTASGAPFNPNDPTIAAHRSLAFGTRVRVTNPENNVSLVVVIRDRGPFIAGRELDLTRAAANILGFRNQGVATMHMTVLD